ncbi:hypothetical protein Q4519_08585 [Motilimonas sp. 1_MG-2023]|uniref:Uncharacterized protein n=1 Tax=Motilimonas cestriensis TaxID=2742685 RepID=A0ABS8WBS9_9GAMM|nr:MULTISPECIES: hypothetical protein [Motilimonas]MCE2596474.1 hypothetical protein [Motilimonas cestriensis]MDO6525741.1 hypothetical protein [Motilimonas sp. 1_MG-2023]
MKTYSERTRRPPDFIVEYRFLTHDEGGRESPPHQHTRWDFLYAGDDPKVDGINMIWPEFISEAGEVLPEGEVSSSGKALMFILVDERREYHSSRIAVGTMGYFTEGSKKVAECKVTDIVGLLESS